MKTYKNINGRPIIRSCFNCIYYLAIPTEKNSGYCKFKALYFAYTLQNNVYPIVKTFYLCDNHRLNNEQYLSEIAEQVDMEDILKTKAKIDT